MFNGDGRLVVVGLIVICATLLYIAGLAVSQPVPVEPQSIFTLYGAVLGFLFGVHSQDKKQRLGEKEREREREKREKD